MYRIAGNFRRSKVSYELYTHFYFRTAQDIDIESIAVE